MRLIEILSPPSDIHMAVNENDLTKVKVLISQGIDINQTDSRGRTPLYLSAMNGNYELTRYLLSSGADPYIGASWKDNATPVHTASAHGHLEIVGLLITKGAVDPNIADDHGITPLHYSARYRNADIVRFLLENNADVKIRDSYNKTVLHGYEVSEIKGDRLLTTLKILIDSGADINAISDIGETPLMNMVLINSKEAVKFLLENGADSKFKNKNGIDALHVAKVNNLLDIENLLLQKK